MVQSMAGLGLRQIDIALVLDIDPKTLRLYYRRELDRGRPLAHMNVARTLYQQAIAGNTAALIYWTKSQMGWREKQEVQLSGPGGGPVTFRWASSPAEAQQAAQGTAEEGEEGELGFGQPEEGDA
jgi:hypothetical protein